MVEPVFKDVFHNETVALRRGKVGHHGLLQIGWETGIGKGLDVDRACTAVAADADEEITSVIPLDYLRAALHQLCGDRFQVGGNDVVNHNIPMGSSRGDHECASLNLIRNDCIGAAVQLPPAENADYIRASALYGGAHHVEEVGHVYHMRLFCCIGDDRLPLCADGGEHDVDCCAYADHVQVDLCTDELLCMRLYHAALDYNICTKRAHALDVLIDGALADGAAAGQGDLRMTITAKHRPQQVIGSAQAAHHVKRNGVGVDALWVNAHRAIRCEIHIRAHVPQNLLQNAHILNLRQVFHHAAFPCKNDGRDDRHSGVFCAANGHAAFQPVPAVYHKMRHRFSFNVVFRGRSMLAARAACAAPAAAALPCAHAFTLICALCFAAAFRALHLRERSGGDQFIKHLAAGFAAEFQQRHGFFLLSQTSI